jgi:integrase/recombinase XerD
MSDARQLPLFVRMPQTEGELYARTHFADTITLFQQYLARQGKTEHTISAFTADLHLAGEYLGARTPIGAFTTAMLNDFLHWLEFERGVPCSRKSYARRVTTLKVYFKWLVDIGALDFDPALAVLQRSGPAPLALVLSDEEVEAAGAYAASLARGEKPDVRPALLFRLLLETGIKKSEAARIVPDDFERDAAGDSRLLVRQSSPRNPYKERRLAVSPLLDDLLSRYLAQYQPKTLLFTCTPRNLEYILEAVGVGAGLDKKISFEMMRWTSGVRDYLAGYDPNGIREKLGLSRISWVETFAKIRRLAGEDPDEDADDDQ